MNMNQAAVIVGMGEMGGVFGRALLRYGVPVVPVLRRDSMEEIAAVVTEPSIVLVTVGEADLDTTLADLPVQWRSGTGLVQNELLPRDWRRHGITNPTVASVWFEKKPGQDFKVIIPTPIAGPGAPLLLKALATLGIAAKAVNPNEELMYELVRKNLYILTANIAGLVTRGSVDDLWNNNRDHAQKVAGEVLEIQAWLTGETLDAAVLVDGMVEAIDGDPDHGSTGRSAPNRLARALTHADEAGLKVPTLREIAASLA